MSEKYPPIIPCGPPLLTREEISDYAERLKKIAHTVGDHGFDKSEFWERGLFDAAVEKLRGAHAATMAAKTKFVSEILDYLKAEKSIVNWNFEGSRERHDYVIDVDGKLTCGIEQKGCLDGNNTTIFTPPPNAKEFIIWSLCPNAGSNMHKNAWSGIHIRLSADIMQHGKQVDGLVIWDYLCGTSDRPCPKTKVDPTRFSKVGSRTVTPPCIYLFPRSTPDARNNPHPEPWDIEDVSFLRILYNSFQCNPEDVVKVHIEARMDGNERQRQTSFFRNGRLLRKSRWTTIKQSK